MVLGGWREIRLYQRDALICLSLFTLAVLAGHIVAVLNVDRAAKYYDLVKEVIIADSAGIIPEDLFLFILSRNTLVSFTLLVLGIVTYNVWPVFVVLLNGVLAGFIVQTQAFMSDQSVLLIWLFGLLPHGVPELGAIFLAAGASFYYRRRRGQGERIIERLLKTFLTVVLPLLIIAAIIETSFTPFLISTFLL